MKKFDDDVESVDFKKSNHNKKIQEFVQKAESTTLKVSLFDLAQAKKNVKKNSKTV